MSTAMKASFRGLSDLKPYLYANMVAEATPDYSKEEFENSIYRAFKAKMFSERDKDGIRY